MKVLLIGSYSSLFENYVAELSEDYLFKLAGTGDGWKLISKSQLYFPQGKTKLKRLLSLMKLIFLKKAEYRGFDLIILQSPFIFGGLNNFFNFNLHMIKFIKNNNKNLVMFIAGTDYVVYNSRLKMNNNPFDRSVMIDLNRINPYTDKLFIKNNMEVIKLLDRIFYSSPMYGLGYKRFNKTYGFPVQLPSFRLETKIQEKDLYHNEIIVYHGINRLGFKGSDIILAAIDKLEKIKLPNVKFIVTEKVPFQEFKKNLELCDIYIDQCFSDDYGMATLLALGMGKVVLTSLVNYCEKEEDHSQSPIIRIEPNVGSVFDKLKNIVSSPIELQNRAKNALSYVEKNHNPRKSFSIIVDNLNG